MEEGKTRSEAENEEGDGWARRRLRVFCTLAAAGPPSGQAAVSVRTSLQRSSLPLLARSYGPDTVTCKDAIQ